MFAEGDRNKFRTICTPNEIGYALPTVLRLQKEAEEKQQKENDRLAEKEKWDARKQTNQKVINAASLRTRMGFLLKISFQKK